MQEAHVMARSIDLFHANQSDVGIIMSSSSYEQIDFFQCEDEEHPNAFRLRLIGQGRIAQQYHIGTFGLAFALPVVHSGRERARACFR